MNALRLLLLTVGILIVGCRHGSDLPLNLLKVDTVDNDTNLKVTYTAYREKAGREIKHGVLVMWYESGRKYIEANYSRGELNGKFTIFTEEGKPEVEGIYRHGKPWDGEFQIGHEIFQYAAGKSMGKRVD